MIVTFAEFLRIGIPCVEEGVGGGWVGEEGVVLS